MNKYRAAPILLLLLLLLLTASCKLRKRSDLARSSFKLTNIASEDSSSRLICRAYRKGDNRLLDGVSILIAGDTLRLEEITDNNGFVMVKLPPGSYKVWVLFGNTHKTIDNIKISPNKKTVLRCYIYFRTVY